MAVLVLLALVAAKVATDAGAPGGLLSAAQAAAFALIAAAAATRRAPWLDAPRAALLALAVLLFPTVYGEVGGDGIQAFVVARSVVLDGDLDLANDYAGLGAPVVATAAGVATSHLPVGLALLWIPAFLLAHAGVALAAAAGAPLAADGFSVPYRSAVTAATYLYATLGLLLLEAEVRRRHGRAVALLAALGIWLATPLHFYMTANPAMAHGVSVFAASAFVVGWLRVRERHAAPPRAWALVGLLGALMTLVRLQDAVLLALPAADLAARRPPRWTASMAGYAAAAALLGSVQLLAWLRLFGSGFLPAVLGFNLVGGTEPNVAGVLLSPRHGLFYWTPLYVLCVIGWLAWMRRDLRVGLLVAAGFAASVLVNASMQDWWGSEAFGQRRLLGLTPLFALGLGEALGALGKPWRRLAAAALAVLAAWTWSFEGIYNSGVVAPRDQAITYAQLTRAQADALRRRLVRMHGRLPARLWAPLWSASGGKWLDEAPLHGRVD
ncbi:MAG TPA: hypothetical protein VMR21_11365, partial [Vicinamibacteria bacterium]|nr:hypothetical protein [Vicinamibacteria bacterium]